MQKNHKRILFRSLAVTLSLVFSLSILEVSLRLTHSKQEPIAVTQLPPPQERRFGWFQVDPELMGWTMRPGEYNYTYLDGSIRVTVLPDSTRATSDEIVESTRSILIIGGSYTLGQDISDEDTYPWRVQEAFPDVRVINAGVSAYGTLQSLMRYENILESDAPKPEVVVYGFPIFHMERNVVTLSWRDALTLDHYIPYATLDDSGELIRHSPENVVSWPLQDQLETVALLRRTALRYELRNREAQEFEVTMRLIREMKNIVESNNAQLLVAILGDSSTPGAFDATIAYLEQNDIFYLDCRLPHDDLSLFIANQSREHPNRNGNQFFADCIIPGIAELIP